MILEESSKTDVLVVLDVPFFYRENPLDPTVKRLFNFILAYLRALSESKIVVVSTEINMDEQPIAIKSSMFWSDCICEVDQLKDSNSEFILKILDRNARVEVKLGIAFENDGGIIWKIL